MKICIPTVGNSGLKEGTYAHFGTAKFFNIYDTESKNLEIIESINVHDNHSSCQPIKALGGHQVDVVLTGGMGARAVQIFNENSTKVYRLEGNTVEEAIQKFEAGELQELTMNTACQGHDCN